jgi:hypothetical protein
MDDAIMGLCDGCCASGECTSCDEFRVVYSQVHARERCAACHETIGKNATRCDSCWTFCMGDEASKEESEP